MPAYRIGEVLHLQLIAFLALYIGIVRSTCPLEEWFYSHLTEE
jgi:hypothetical protein